MMSMPQDAEGDGANFIRIPLGLPGLRVVGQRLDRAGQMEV